MSPKILPNSSKNDNKASTFIRSNIRYLRDLKGKTLEEMAQYLGLSGKSAYRAYEQGDAVPAIHILMKLASYFDVSLDELVRFDLTKEAIKVDIKEAEVSVIPIKARAGYLTGFEDASYLDGLKKISIPYKPYGIARAFEIDGDSMEPQVSNGSFVVGVKVNRNEFQSGKDYIVVTNDGEVMYKTVMQAGETLNLISRNIKYNIQEIKSENVVEMWRYFCHVNKLESI